MTSVAIAAETRLSVGCSICVPILVSGFTLTKRMASSDFQDDLKALQKNSGAGHLNELIEDGRHLTDAAWKAAMDLIIGNDDDGGFRVTEVVRHLRAETVVIQEYGVELLIEDRRR
ncbi:hypothetical protein C4D60_Mb11t20240 [Musa balbisiana]|uniref:Uncharacterized protein n=1 Tax=Musa balbisiana TaxID=52838 RepID=A0A4V4H5P3_MUSBA|nr:hypothetical protein C4D60_Mb11t20240 [Musa balbisiana]